MRRWPIFRTLGWRKISRELQRAVELLEAERLRRLAEIDRRGLHERDGFLSAASWLASSHKVAWGNARAELRIARALRDMPR